MTGIYSDSITLHVNFTKIGDVSAGGIEFPDVLSVQIKDTFAFYFQKVDYKDAETGDTESITPEFDTSSLPSIAIPQQIDMSNSFNAASASVGK